MRRAETYHYIGAGIQLAGQLPPEAHPRVLAALMQSVESADRNGRGIVRTPVPALARMLQMDPAELRFYLRALHKAGLIHYPQTTRPPARILIHPP